jgi:hypothetical protein
MKIKSIYLLKLKIESIKKNTSITIECGCDKTLNEGDTVFIIFDTKQSKDTFQFRCENCVDLPKIEQLIEDRTYKSEKQEDKIET